MACALLTGLCLALATGCAHTRNAAEGGAELALSKADRDFAEALAHFSRALICENERGAASDEAVEHLARALELDPGRHRLHSRMAVANLRKRLPDRAIETLKESCARNPKSLKARIDLAVAYQATGQFDPAIKNYYKALSLAPTNSNIRLTLAGLLFYEEKDDKAIRVLLEGVKKADVPDALLAYAYGQGRSFIHNGEPARSIACLRFVAENVKSHRAQLYHQLGEVHQALGQTADAVRGFKRAITEDNPMPDSFIRLALLYLKSDVPRAIATLTDADRLMPDTPQILLALASMHMSEEQFDKAIAMFERIMEKVTTSENQQLTPDFYLYYGSACERGGHLRKAEEVFEKCLDIYPDTHRVLNYLAYMWAENNTNLDEALMCVTKALELDPDNAAYVDTLGWVYFKQSQYAQALEHIERARKLVGNDDPTIVEHIADTLNAMNKESDAVLLWQESFRLDPENKAVAQKLAARGINVEKLRREAKREARRKKQATTDNSSAEDEDDAD